MNSPKFYALFLEVADGNPALHFSNIDLEFDSKFYREHFRGRPLRPSFRYPQCCVFGEAANEQCFTDFVCGDNQAPLVKRRVWNELASKVQSVAVETVEIGGEWNDYLFALNVLELIDASHVMDMKHSILHRYTSSNTIISVEKCIRRRDFDPPPLFKIRDREGYIYINQAVADHLCKARCTGFYLCEPDDDVVVSRRSLFGTPFQSDGKAQQENAGDSLA